MVRIPLASILAFEEQWQHPIVPTPAASPAASVARRTRLSSSLYYRPHRVVMRARTPPRRRGGAHDDQGTCSADHTPRPKRRRAHRANHRHRRREAIPPPRWPVDGERMIAEAVRAARPNCAQRRRGSRHYPLDRSENQTTRDVRLAAVVRAALLRLAHGAAPEPFRFILAGRTGDAWRLRHPSRMTWSVD